MELTYAMRVFVKVVEGGSFSAAARTLGVPVSTVSRQVAKLEETLGARLLRRSTRSMTPTEAGQSYFARAKPIVADIDEMHAEIADREAVPRGRVRVSMPPVVAGGLEHPIAAFQRSYPQVQLEVDVGTRFVDLVAEGFDVALRAGVLRDSALRSRTLARLGARALASRDYLDEYGRPESIDDLPAHRCLVHGVATARWPLRDGGHIPIDSALLSNDVALLLESMRAGQGIAVLPESLVADRLRSGEVEVVLEDEIGADTTVSLVYPEGRFRSASVRAFIEFMANASWLAEGKG